MKVGILALQGDYEAHAKVLDKLNIAYTFVRHPKHLATITGLILPGGESTTLLHLLKEDNFLEAIRDFADNNYLFGTCAGAILLAKEVTQSAQPSLGLIDVAVERNAYGRQLDSQIVEGSLFLDESNPVSIEMVFIRAPKITRVGSAVQVFATYQDQPVGVHNDRCMLTTFHPELTSSTLIHEYFITRLSATKA